MKRCMYCGHENEDTSSTCSVCGNKLGVPIPTVDAVVEEVSLDEPKESAPDAETADAGAAEAEGVRQAPSQEAAEALDEASDEAMVTQEPAFAGQTPVNEQFAETTPGGQFTEEESAPVRDDTPGFGEDWRQDVGRGQTYGARRQYEARQEERPEERPSRDQYGSAGYGYRQPQGQAGAQRDYGRRESSGGSKAFMVRARKRVKSVTFFLMSLSFTAMLALNVYNIYCGNALRNIKDANAMLDHILGGSGRSFFTQMLSELASQMVSMIVNVQEIVAQLGATVELSIAVVVLIPNILFCLGLWLMFFRTDTKRRQFPMGGYTLTRVMMALKFIIACLIQAVGLVIAVYFVVVSAQGSSASVDSSLVQGVIVLVVMIILSVFVVMYYIQWMFCLKVVKVNSKTGADPGRMPGFLVFLSLLCTAACVLLMIPMAPNDYIGLASRAAAAAYFLFSGLWVLTYKIKVKRG